MTTKPTHATSESWTPCSACSVLSEDCPWLIAWQLDSLLDSVTLPASWTVHSHNLLLQGLYPTKQPDHLAQVAQSHARNRGAKYVYNLAAPCAAKLSGCSCATQPLAQPATCPQTDFLWGHCWPQGSTAGHGMHLPQKALQCVTDKKH
jgi:hypothetical protein